MVVKIELFNNIVIKNKIVDFCFNIVIKFKTVEQFLKFQDYGILFYIVIKFNCRIIFKISRLWNFVLHRY